MAGSAVWLGSQGSGVLSVDLSGGDLVLGQAILYQFGQKGAVLRLIITASGGDIVAPSLPGREVDIQNDGAADVTVRTSTAAPGVGARIGPGKMGTVVCKADASNYEVVSVSGAGGGGTSSVIFRPGAPTSAPFYATAAEVKSLIDDASGDLLVEVDSSIAPAVWDVNVDGKERLTLGGARLNTSGGPAPSLLTVAPGVSISNLRRVLDGLRIEGNAQGAVPSIDQQNGAILHLATGAVVANAATATRPAIRQTAGGVILSQAANVALDVNGTAFAVVEVTGVGQQSIMVVLNRTPGSPPANYDGTFSTTDATATFTWLSDSSAEQLPTLPGWAGLVNGRVTIESAGNTPYDDGKHLPKSENTTTTAPFNTPAPWADVTIAITDSQGSIVGDVVQVDRGGVFKVKNIVDSTHVQITRVPTAGDPPTGSLVPQGGAYAHIAYSVQNAIDTLKGSAVYARGATQGPTAAPYNNAGAAFTSVLSLPLVSPIDGTLRVWANASLVGSAPGTGPVAGAGANFRVLVDGLDSGARASGPVTLPGMTSTVAMCVDVHVTPGPHTIEIRAALDAGLVPGGAIDIALNNASITYEVSANA